MHQAREDRSVVGVLLAAGRGRRMRTVGGRGKLLLPWPPNSRAAGATVIASAFDAIAAHADQMVVVLGHEADTVVAALGSRRFTRVTADADAQMFESVKAGLRAAMSLQPPPRIVLLHPADHPEAPTEIVRELLKRAVAQPPRAAMPEYRGRGGHPVAIPASLIPGVLNEPSEGEAGCAATGGLRGYWQRHPDQCVRLPVADARVVRDIDVPTDYEEQDCDRSETAGERT